MHPNFQVGDKAVYPARGVGSVVGLETKRIGALSVTFYQLEIRRDDKIDKISVPVDKAEENGMRPVAQGNQLGELYQLLRDRDIACDRQTWNRRYRGFMEKIRTGSIFDGAEVYRDLSLLKMTKSLSHGEREMLRRARTLLVQELSVARETSEDQIAQELEALFQN